MDVRSPYSRQAFLSFIRQDFLPEDFSETQEKITTVFKNDYSQEIIFLGHCQSLELSVYEIRHTSENDPRVSLAKETFRLLAYYLIKRALVIFVSPHSQNYRFSLITLDFRLQDGKITKEYSNPRRYSFFLGPDCKAHTLQQFLVQKGRITDLPDLKSRFSIEVVNKEFYNKIAVLFTKLVGGERRIGSKTVKEKGLLQLPGHPIDANHRLYQEFAVRLIGRLLFCWFLKKKSSRNGRPLVSDDALSVKAVKKHHNYYHTILEPLFFQVLNTQMSARPDAVKNELFEQTPFLNGGLFQPHEDDFYDPDSILHISKYQNTLKISDDWLSQLLDVFETYNFTIDENTTIDIELSIDPEMLGLIFENLLAEINPETGETARKATGSFYTPRPIVEYMVDESLKQYLKTKTALDDDVLTKLLSYSDDISLSPQWCAAVIQALDDLKALDPACGSGAFPMGLLQKILLILQKVDPQAEAWQKRILDSIPDPTFRSMIAQKLAHDRDLWDYSRKLGIIRKSLYGIDIQPIAVEISKLRVFLSLIVDEKVDDAKPNRGIEPLPNLEFKFVAANTLIGLPVSGMGSLSESDSILAELKRLRENYFASFGADKKQIETRFDALQQELAREVINWNPGNNRAFLIAKWNPFKHESAPFFDPEWMFGGIGGFDIVIGNPPYMRIQTLQLTQPTFIAYYRDYYLSARGSFDIYALFVEGGMRFVSSAGQLVYILPHKFFQASFGSELRKLLTNKKALRQVIRFGAEQVFNEATTYTCLLFLSNKPIDHFNLFEVRFNNESKVLSSIFEKREHPDYQSGLIAAPIDENWDFSIGAHNRVMQKIRQHKQTIGDVTRKIFQGIATSSDKIYILKIVKELGNTILCYSNQLEDEFEIEKGLTRPFLMGKDVHRYENPVPKNAVIFPYWIKQGKAVLMTQKEIEKNFPKGWKYLLKNKKELGDRERGRMHGEQFYAFIYPKNLIEFDAVKIMTPDICGKPEMTIDKSGLFYHTTTIYSFVFNENAQYSHKVYLGILNSKVIWYFLSQTGNVLRGNYLRFKTEYLKPFPIPKADRNQQEAFEKYVEYALHLKNDNSDLSFFIESLIDAMVYELYFPKEIKAVGGEVLKHLSNLQELQPSWSDEQKMKTIKKVYTELSNPAHPVSIAMHNQKTVPEVRIIEGL